MKNPSCSRKRDSHTPNLSNLGLPENRCNALNQRNQVAFILTLIVLALASISCSGYELKNAFSLRFRNLFGRYLKQGLVLDQKPLEGLVEGTFRDAQGQKIAFFAGESGFANLLLFTNKHADPMVLYVREVNTIDAVMRYSYIDPNGQWYEVYLDGMEVLTPDEQHALDHLMNNGLVEAVMLLPLDLACQAEDQVTPQQLAALLYPLQILMKYQVRERAALAEKLMLASQCDYGIREDIVHTTPPLISLSVADPIPAVLGFFPFDPEGAVEGTTTHDDPNKMACLGSSVWPTGADPRGLSGVDGLPAPDSIIGQFGPCEAKCRGACGSDCTLNNCTLVSEDRCEKDEDGTNTGSWSIFHIYTCGLHPACVKHDACYDDCNQRYGCGTWAAAFCKHSVTFVTAPFEYFSGTYLSCDSTTLIEENPLNVKDWVRGYGPKTEWQVFEYRDAKFNRIFDSYQCPLRAAETNTDTEIPEERQPSESQVLPEPPAIPIDEQEQEGPLLMSIWVEVGEGDCVGHDYDRSNGFKPDNARAALGYTAVCWDGSTYNNTLEDGNVFCTYKSISWEQCTGGANIGKMYTAIDIEVDE